MLIHTLLFTILIGVGSGVYAVSNGGGAKAPYFTDTATSDGHRQTDNHWDD